MARKVFEREVGDMLRGMYPLVIHQIDLRGPRFTIRKTVDYIYCYEDGTFGALEVKQAKTDSFAFARIREHQREALSKVAGTKHGRAYLALNFRDAKGPGQAYLIPWKWLTDFVSTWSKKSIRRVEAEEEFLPFSLRRVRGGWERRGNFFSQP